jgi:hypothetical protein
MKYYEVRGNCIMFHNIYCAPNIIRVNKPWSMRRAGHVAPMREKKSAFRVHVGKPEGKRLLETPSRKMEDNIKTDLR